MKLIDKIIKILINFKYKREPFMTWSWGIDDIHEISIISAEYYNDHYRYGTTEKYYKAESEEELRGSIYHGYMDGFAGISESEVN